MEHNGERYITFHCSPTPNRLLTQMERILEINTLQEVTKAAVESGSGKPGDRRDLNLFRCRGKPRLWR
jgi:hypothetical protein